MRNQSKPVEQSLQVLVKFLFTWSSQRLYIMLAHTWLLTFTLNFSKLLTHLYGSISFLLHSATGEIVHVLCISKRCLTSCYQSKVPVPDASKKHTNKPKKTLKTSEFEIRKVLLSTRQQQRREDGLSSENTNPS